MDVAEYHGLNPDVHLDFPLVHVDDFSIDLLTFDYQGTETETTDDFRDYIRKWGIRIYTERPFKS